MKKRVLYTFAYIVSIAVGIACREVLPSYQLNAYARVLFPFIIAIPIFYALLLIINSACKKGGGQ
jgi:hypothetical protein